MNRRNFLALVATASILAGRSVAAATRIDVYKSPDCDCCNKWAEHLRQSGFGVSVNEVRDVSAVRAKAGVPAALASCHTALVDGYVVEGHVPAADIKRLLKDRPRVLGLVVPGMPKGSPGMEAARGEAYDVLLLDKGGTTRVYRSYAGT
jgi:hypothetical protein